MRRTNKNKQLLFEWLVEADFEKEISLVEIMKHPFQLNEEEQNVIDVDQILKIVKVLMYKIGLGYKRQEIFKGELIELIKESQEMGIKKVEKEINSVNEAVQQVHIELEDYLSKNKSFKADLIKSVDTIKQSALNQQGIKSVLDGMLLLSACQSEFIQMQSYLDAVALKQRSAIVARVNELTPSFD